MTYDALGRLTSFKYKSQPLVSYILDPWGNMASASINGNQVTFDSHNRVSNMPCTGPDGTAYDAAGNLLCDGDQAFVGTMHKYSVDPENRIAGVADSASVPLASYSLNAEGGRVRKDLNNGSWTEYMSMGGSVYAEFDPTRGWKDYIFANGKIIAKTSSTQPVLYMAGTNTCDPSICGGQYTLAVLPVPEQERPIRLGDTIQYMQNNVGPAACGGLTLVFSGGGSMNFASEDQNGSMVNVDSTQGWHERTFKLDPWQGQTVTYAFLDNENCGFQGSWKLEFSDVSISGSDGVVTTIFNQQEQTYLQPGYTNGVSNVTAGTDLRTSNDPLNTTYYMSDQVGTTSIEMSSQGWALWKGEFDPYGQLLKNNATSMHYQFTGKERDAESGLDYFGARYYASNMGRMMSPDPSGLAFADIGNPQSFNLYSYVLNNPLSFTDPSGMECVWDDGSFDSADDKDTGSRGGCSAQGGNYVDPAQFKSLNAGDWSNQANQTIADVGVALNNSSTSVYVYGNGASSTYEYEMSASDGILYNNDTESHTSGDRSVMLAEAMMRQGIPRVCSVGFSGNVGGASVNASTNGQTSGGSAGGHSAGTQSPQNGGVDMRSASPLFKTVPVGVYLSPSDPSGNTVSSVSADVKYKGKVGPVPVNIKGSVYANLGTYNLNYDPNCP